MGTVLLTGANSSLGIPTAAYLSSHYPTYTLLLTVRNRDKTKDPNTARLINSLSNIPHGAGFSVRKLDLASLPEVTAFAESVKSEISQGKLPPLKAIICNAYFWGITSGLQFSADGYEKTFAVVHLAHFSLVLRLLGSFDRGSDGRIVNISSDAHFPGRSPLEVFPPSLPGDLESLVRPPPDKPDEVVGRGVQRYAVSKLVSLLCMYELNRRLEVRCTFLMENRNACLNALNPVLRLVQPNMRRSHQAAVDVAEISVGEAYKGQKGYFELRKKTESSVESMDVKKQQLLWERSVEWCGIGADDTALEIEKK